MRMTIKGNMQNNRVLSDLFLDILESVSDTQQRIYINNVRASLNIPECAELFNVALVNALGVKTPIDEDTVKRAVDALISCNKADIDNTHNISNEERERRKNLMIAWMKDCEEALIFYLRKESLLE